MGKHEAKVQATRSVRMVQCCKYVAKHARHPLGHISALIVLHTIATVILTKSPIALILH